MDLPPPQSTAEASVSNKLRLMCFYGGRIIPRPSTKSLFYAGGDTRIITVSTTATTTLALLLSHVKTALRINSPFILKYQLPNHDLDFLVSLCTDDDLQIMLEEHLRVISPPLSRVRLFFFPVKTSIQQANPESAQSELKHPKTDTWFVDALKNVQTEGNCLVEGEIHAEGIGGSELCGAESLALETNSSFGSTSSSTSSSKLPSKGNVEENVAVLQGSKIKLQLPDFVPRETCAAIPQGEVVLPTLQMENKIPIPTHGTHMPKLDQPLDYQRPSYLDSSQQKQQLLYGVLPPRPCYSVYNQQPQLYYLPNQSQPVYLLPFAQTPSYNSTVQCGLLDTAATDPSRHQIHQNIPFIASQVTYKEGRPVYGAASGPDPATTTATDRTGFGNTPRSENLQQAGAFPQMQYHFQHNDDVSNLETCNYCNDVDEDLVRVQIYNSQPPPPVVPSHFQPMGNCASDLLSEASTSRQLHSDSIEHQISAPQLQ